MTSLDHAPFTPFMSKRTAQPPGITPLKLSDWPGTSRRMFSTPQGPSANQPAPRPTRGRA